MRKEYVTIEMTKYKQIRAGKKYWPMASLNLTKASIPRPKKPVSYLEVYPTARNFAAGQGKFLRAYFVYC